MTYADPAMRAEAKRRFWKKVGWRRSRELKHRTRDGRCEHMILWGPHQGERCPWRGIYDGLAGRVLCEHHLLSFERREVA